MLNITGENEVEVLQTYMIHNMKFKMVIVSLTGKNNYNTRHVQ